MVVQLCVDQIRVDLILLYIALLRHLGKRTCQVNNGVSSVMLRKEKHSEMLALFFEMVAIGLGGLWRRVWRRVGAQVGCAKGEGGSTTRSEVGFQCAPDTGVGLREIVLEYICLS